MLPWIIVAALYVFGALTMTLLVIEWGYKFTLRTKAVIVAWPIVSGFAFVCTFFLD